jgi:1,2-diacylglycerol 3-beta-glucosyltransferase
MSCTIAVVAGGIVYAIFVLWLLARLFPRTAARPQATVSPPGISLVIPFRNEARRLGGCLESLASQRHAGPWEVILVNDGSTDDYSKAIEPFTASFPAPIVLVDSRYETGVRLTSKQQALDAGVARSRYEWLLFTDADMHFSNDWLSTWAVNAADGDALCFGRTAITKDARGLFSFVQRFQLDFLFTAAFAFHAAGIGGSCMGNNVLVKKNAYERIGGQAGIGYSIVEDRDLYAAFRRKKMPVSPAQPFTAGAFTFPCETVGAFYRQMLRWARGGFTLRSPLLWAGLLFMLENAALVASLTGALSGAAAVIAVANFFLTVLFVHAGFKRIGSRENALLFPAYFVFLLLETVVIVLSIPFMRRMAWKGRPV